jgi:hypothetical protein
MTNELVTQGRLAVIDAEVLVVLPETVKPKHIGRLGLFKFQAESYAHDKGDPALLSCIFTNIRSKTNRKAG